MRRSSFLLALVTILVAGLGFAIAQVPSAGGSFLPLESYVLGPNARWTWKNSTDPICLEGTTDNDNEVCIAPADPTADRTLTTPDTTGHLVAAEDGATASAIRAGSVTLDGSNPTSVTTGLSVILACHADLMAAATPSDDPIGFTLDTHAAAGRLDIYAYKTDGSDPTWTASTASALLRWFCVGTP